MKAQLLPTKDMNTDYSCFRLCPADRLAQVKRSLSLSGQLQPVTVRSKAGGYQLLDGFKRLYAARSLGWDSLDCRVVEADDCQAKVLILTCNVRSGGLLDYEQAVIIHSLRREHLLDQGEIARLTGRSVSWVSRRLSFIERLDESVVTELKTDHITATHGRELSRLPRGKQAAFVKMIIGESLTSRQSGLLIKKYLSARTAAEEQFILSHPREVIERSMAEGDLQDSRLGAHGNRLLKTSRLLMRQQHIFIGQSTNPPLEELSVVEREVLSPTFAKIAVNANQIQHILKTQKL